MKVFVNFFWFLYRVLKNINKEHFVSNEIKNKRLDICKNCIKIDNSSFLSKIKGSRCGVCGCFLEYKTLFKYEECADEPPQWSIEK